MHKKPFRVTFDSLAEKRTEYPRIEEQLPSLIKNYQNSTVCISLFTKTGYTYAYITLEQDGFLVNPVPGYHGIGDSGTGDSFTDTLKIMQEGFHIEDLNTVNMYVGAHVPTGAVPWGYAVGSNIRENLFDCYNLAVHELRCPYVFQNPRVLKSDWFHVFMERAHPKDMSLIVDINRNTQVKNTIATLDYYKDVFSGFGEVVLKETYLQASKSHVYPIHYEQ